MEKVSSFTIGNYAPWLSDHCPLYTTISLSGANSNVIHKDTKLKNKDTGYSWKLNSKEQFEYIINSREMKRKNEIPSGIRNTLGAETFAGRNFREFREFLAFLRKFIPRNISKNLIRESLCPRKIYNFLFAKVNSASLNKNELQWLLKFSFPTITTVHDFVER